MGRKLTEEERKLIEQQRKESIKRSKAKYREKNRELLREKNKKYSKENPEIVKNSKLKYRAKNKQNIKEQRRQMRYGITKQQYDEMLERQQYCCAICSKTPKKTLDVDHCHSNGEIRGLLCNSCNQALGLFKDNKQYISMAIQYLENQGVYCE